MPADPDERSHTTLWVRRETAARLEGMKPYHSITWDEFLSELADTYENSKRET